MGHENAGVKSLARPFELGGVHGKRRRGERVSHGGRRRTAPRMRPSPRRRLPAHVDHVRTLEREAAAGHRAAAQLQDGLLARAPLPLAAHADAPRTAPHELGGGSRVQQVVRHLKLLALKDLRAFVERNTLAYSAEVELQRRVFFLSLVFSGGLIIEPDTEIGMLCLCSLFRPSTFVRSRLRLSDTSFPVQS